MSENKTHENITMTPEQFGELMKRLEKAEQVATEAKATGGNAQVEELIKKVEALEQSNATLRAVASGKSFIAPAKKSDREIQYFSYSGTLVYQKKTKLGLEPAELAIKGELPQVNNKTFPSVSEITGRYGKAELMKKGIFGMTGLTINDYKYKESKKELPAWAGKKVSEFTADECQEYASFYEAFGVPVSGAVQNMRTAVANHWCEIFHNVASNRPLIIDKKVVDKQSQVIEIVNYNWTPTHTELTDLSTSQIQDMVDIEKMKSAE